MKKSFLTLALLAGTILSLSAADLKLPIYWKAKISKTPGKYQTLAFAYKADKENMYFAYQIHELGDLIREDNPTMACYFNTDNDIKTGRFPKACGWDMQFNIRLHLNTPAVVRWIGNKGITVKYKKGEVTTRISGDIYLITIKKSVLKDFTFKDKMVARAFQGYKNQKIKIVGMERGIVTAGKNLGELVIKD